MKIFFILWILPSFVFYGSPALFLSCLVLVVLFHFVPRWAHAILHTAHVENFVVIFGVPGDAEVFLSFLFCWVLVFLWGYCNFFVTGNSYDIGSTFLIVFCAWVWITGKIRICQNLMVTSPNHAIIRYWYWLSAQAFNRTVWIVFVVNPSKPAKSNKNRSEEFCSYW